MSGYYIKLSAYLMFLWILCVIPLYGQTNNCIELGDKIVCSIKEDEKGVIGPFRVPNSSNVVIQITEKSPFDDCSFGEIKLTDIKETDPITTILQLFTKAATGLTLANLSVSPAVKSIDPSTFVANTDEKRLLRDALFLQRNLEGALSVSSATITVQGSYTRTVINPLFANPPRNAAAYNAIVPGIKTQIENYISQPEATFESEQVRYAILRERLKVMLNTPGNDPAAGLLPDIMTILNNIGGQLTALKTNYDSLSTAKTQFKAILAFLEDTDFIVNSGGGFQKDLPLPRFNQQEARTSVSCSNTFTKKTTIPQIPVVVLYKSDSPLFVSVGPLFSTLPKQKLGITPINTGLNSSGAPTFRSEFGIVDRASFQVIPFVFINYRIKQFGRGSNPVKPAPFSFNLSAGVGVNPNSGSSEVEYFVGGGLGYKKYLIQFGDHVGRFQEGFTGGFNIGDTVPASFPSTLPIRKVYKHRFGIGFSYRITF